MRMGTTYLTLCEQNDLLMMLQTTCKIYNRHHVYSVNAFYCMFFEKYQFTYIVALHFAENSFEKWDQTPINKQKKYLLISFMFKSLRFARV